MLNPLKVKVNENQLQTKWYDILEKYYRETDESKYLEFINNLKKKTEKQNRMVLIESAFLLYSLGVPIGEETLNEIGLKGNLKSRVLQERTKYRMLVAKEEKEQQESAHLDYYELLGDISISKQVNLNTEMLLIEWVGILKSIKKQNEWENRKIRLNNKGGDRRSF